MFSVVFQTFFLLLKKKLPFEIIYLDVKKKRYQKIDSNCEDVLHSVLRIFALCGNKKTPQKIKLFFFFGDPQKKSLKKFAIHHILDYNFVLKLWNKILCLLIVLQ